MYIQITTRCNMSCEHCCFACTAKGEDMSQKVYEQALTLCDGYIIIGGGEPTLHPLFNNFLMQAMGEGSVWLATNGSITKTALLLAKLAKQGVIGCALSQDQYHDYINPEVIIAFDKSIGYHNQEDLREFRSVTTIHSGGRATENEIWEKEDCGCAGGIIKPNGDIYMCACNDAPKIGTVWDYDYDNKYSEYDCYTYFKEDNQEEIA